MTPAHVLACHPLDRWPEAEALPSAILAPGYTVPENITTFLPGILSGEEQRQMQDVTSPNWFPVQSAWPQTCYEDSREERPSKLEDATVAGPGEAAVGRFQVSTG